MKMLNHSKSLFALVAAASTFVAAHSADAAFFHVTVDTSALIGNLDDYALDFTLTGGNPFANTVTLSNFTFTGGGAANSNPAASTTGLASGSLGTSVTLSDSSVSFFNEFFQGFTVGNTVAFDVNISTNANGPTPDSFAFSILDGELFAIPTNGGPADALLTIDLTGANPTVSTYSSIGGETGGVTVSVVPEPGSALLLGLGTMALGLVRRRRAA
jgi:hypothetical protein